MSEANQIEERNRPSIILKILIELSRTILGVTFLFSGFVKAIDPWGTAYKMQDYFSAFHLSSISYLSLPLAGFLCILEFALGAFMLFGLYRFWTSRLLLLTMCFMTPLTLYLAIANPVSDCGCFGDALIISNWSTFYKNLVLIICAIITFVYYDKISNIFTGKTYWLAFVFIVLFSISFVVRNYIYEPLFDFRPYYIGANIKESMKIKEGDERIEESILIYAKDGIEKEFTQDNFPWEDSTWVFVKADTKIVKEGKAPKIDNFNPMRLILNNDRTELLDAVDITDQILNDSNYVFLMVSPYLAKLNEDYLGNLEDVEYYAKEYGYSFYCLTASTTDQVIDFADKYSVNFEFCRMDDRALKTMARTNPALLLLKNGIVINKWGDVEIPSEQDLKDSLDRLTIGKLTTTKSEKDNSNILTVTAIFFIPLLLLKFFDFFVYRKRKKED